MESAEDKVFEPHVGGMAMFGGAQPGPASKSFVRGMNALQLRTVASQQPWMSVAHRGRGTCADECPLLGVKRTLTNRCLTISIYEYTA